MEPPSTSASAANSDASPLPNTLLPLHEASEAELQPYERTPIVSTFGEPQAEYAALHKSCGLMDLAHRGVLELTGKDRLPFLNNLLTNETWSKATKSGLAAGQGVYAFMLQLNGRIAADLNVLELGDRTLLETDARLIAPLKTSLDKYLFAEQVRVADRTGDLHEMAFHGPRSGDVLASAGIAGLDALPPLGSISLRWLDADVTIWRDDVCGAPGYHVIVPTDAVQRIWQKLLADFGELIAHAKRPLRPVGWAAFNTVRIEAGRPLFGIDFDASVLPAEVGPETFARAVNVHKGCYLGQEIVARMYARKQWARQLVSLRLQGETLPLAGSACFDDAGNQVGGVTSSTVSPLQARSAICFAIVKKLFAADGKAVRVPAEGAFRTATVQTQLKTLSSGADAGRAE